MGLSVMIAGLVLFLGVHLVTTRRNLRARLVASGGEGTYKAGLSLISTIGLARAVIDRVSLKHRADAGAPPIPVDGMRSDAIAVVVGIVACLALGALFHPCVIGVPVFGA